MEQALKRYAQLQSELLEINNELASLRQQLQAEVGEGGAVEAFGFRAYWKPGRNTTDHEAAALAAGVAADVIEKHSTVKTTVAWAKVTKEAGVPKEILEAHTTQGFPSFVVDAVG